MKKHSLKTFIYYLSFYVLALSSTFAHKNHNSVPQNAPQLKPQEMQLFTINEFYKDKVKPIFQKKCFDCHSQNTQYPWYYKIPGAKQLIDDDLKKAKEHLDFSNDFPFGGHGTPNEDLDAIEDVTKDNSMPPFRYWILRWDSRILYEEKRIILEWVNRSKAALKEKNK
ncbi:MAG: heme-binding domain-containing protein [Oligoflexia bacterium]|nr:heme-binding domain-containing protein [Oligoflexia bacterium]